MERTLAVGGAEELSREFRAVWAVLAQACPKSWLYVPPIYEDATLQCVLTTAITQVCQRERGHMTGSTNNVGHVVFGGVEGTGKTTLLRAIVIAVAVLLRSMVPITHTFSEDDNATLPALLISRAAVALHGGAAVDLSGGDTQGGLALALGALRKGGHEVLLAVDEFQHVFALEPEATRRNRTVVASHVKTLSRSHGTYGIIAGSSADMRELMFRSGDIEEPDPWRRAGFPDFNASLYTLYEVPALRSVDSLRGFLTARYPAWEVDAQDVAELLYWTGGISRCINTAWENSGTPTAATPLRGVAVGLCALRTADGTDGTRRLLPSSVFDNPAARVAVTAIVMQNEGAVAADTARDRHTLACIGMPRSMLLQVLRSMGVGSAETLLRRLVDNSVLYAAADQVQLARPCDAHVYFNSGVPVRWHLLLLTAVEMMVRGIPLGGDEEDDGGGAPAAAGGSGGSATEAVTHVNAGNALERLVRGRVAQLMHVGAGAGSLRSDGWRVEVVHGVLCVCVPSSTVWQRLTPDLLEHGGIAGQLMQWRRETGLDGLLLLRKPGPSGASVRHVPTWLLHGWQCKGGQFFVSVTGGALATSINVYVASKTVRDLDTRSSHGILVKAQVGMCKLLLAWRAAMEAAEPIERNRPLLVPASLLITTTKDARLACQSIGAAGGVMRINPLVAAAAGVPTSAWARAAISAPITISVLDGVGWLHECVPTPE